MKYQNEGLPFVKEYLERKRLNEIGVTSNISQISYDRIEAFLIISETFDKLRADEAKKKKRK